jgi:hypothetical protein
VTKGNGVMKIYGLFNPDGVMKKCSDNVDRVTNHFPKNTYTKEMLNALFVATAENRKAIFEQNGWSVKEGEFVETQRQT